MVSNIGLPTVSDCFLSVSPQPEDSEPQPQHTSIIPLGQIRPNPEQRGCTWAVRDKGSQRVRWPAFQKSRVNDSDPAELTAHLKLFELKASKSCSLMDEQVYLSHTNSSGQVGRVGEKPHSGNHLGTPGQKMGTLIPA